MEALASYAIPFINQNNTINDIFVEHTEEKQKLSPSEENPNVTNNGLPYYNLATLQEEGATLEFDEETGELSLNGEKFNGVLDKSEPDGKYPTLFTVYEDGKPVKAVVTERIVGHNMGQSYKYSIIDYAKTGGANDYKMERSASSMYSGYLGEHPSLATDIKNDEILNRGI